jgi:hypothetical protein
VDYPRFLCFQRGGGGIFSIMSTNRRRSSHVQPPPPAEKQNGILGTSLYPQVIPTGLGKDKGSKTYAVRESCSGLKAG